MLELLKKVCEGLESAGIPYMLSGSLALNIYTVPRMTRDIDIVIQLEPQQLVTFLKLFHAGFYFSEPAIQEALANRGMFNVIDQDSGYKLDFIILKTQTFRQVEFSRRSRTMAFGFPVWAVTLEDLIIAKLLWIQEIFSERQLEDIKNLLAHETVDMAYVMSWCGQLKLKTFGLFPDA